MLITLKHDITLFMFMLLFNWGPPDIREILWLSYPPVRYLDTIDAWEPHQWNEFKYLCMSLFFTIFYSLTIRLLVSVLLVRSKVRVWMWVGWVWCEYGWLPFFPVCRAATVTSTSFLSVLHFLFAIQRCSSLSKYYLWDIQFVSPSVYPWEHSKNDECCPGHSLTVNR